MGCTGCAGVKLLIIVDDLGVHGAFQKYDPVVLIERRMGQSKLLEPLVDAVVSVHLTPAALITLPRR